MSSTDPEETTCPYCAETIKSAALVCKHCHRTLGPPQAGVDTQVGLRATQLQVPAAPAFNPYNKENSTGLWAMIFGIVGLVVPCLVFPPIIAIAGGFAGKGKCDRGLANNMGQCTAAIVTGFIGLALTIVAYGGAVLTLSSSQ